MIATVIPAGYRQNAIGHLVPIESIKEIDLTRDQVVQEITTKAMELAGELGDIKNQIAKELEAFLDLSAEQYGVKLGGQRGNITLLSFDGRYKVSREIANRLEFDERLQAAKELVDECLREWTRESGAEVRALIEDAFQVDKKGQINTKRILSLRKLKIEHPTWLRAMEAISDAITVSGTAVYYRIYERTEDGDYRQICLDFSGV